ncbi:alpha/beta hydrolase [Gracilibacillus salinarum]|uniref:Alpha/beta hydrolase n=1 Tax=Gracilibacillus salinarum TaxID=2932255 RepID=A0ABY4GH66_9BACI|nr:alpha/beta hydrolase [Gracilibacillus salinarum]UOQ83681.1 alpha/beta hydrolase [Gracilibacillus salinarum]
MKKWLKRMLILLALFVITGLAFFYYWSQQTYSPSETLDELVDTTSLQYDEDWLLFEPTSKEARKGIIIYPGAKVEPEAYSYYGQTISNEGYFVAIPKIRLNFPILETNKAADLVAQYPAIDNWFIGGHSLGGVAAAKFADENPDIITGIFFLGSYPANSNDFSDTSVPMLSIYAENDGLTTIEKINETQDLLSKEAKLVEIEGGNHAQFGIYGPQKGDEQASISVSEQQDIISEVLLSWLDDH